jgi:hypothetical protein
MELKHRIYDQFNPVIMCKHGQKSPEIGRGVLYYPFFTLQRDLGVEYLR